jgi:hypothetical protein
MHPARPAVIWQLDLVGFLSNRSAAECQQLRQLPLSTCHRVRFLFKLLLDDCFLGFDETLTMVQELQRARDELISHRQKVANWEETLKQVGQSGNW